MGTLLALVLLAQSFAPVAAYTTADPVDPMRLGLATIWGRYSIELGGDCEGIAPDLNVTVWSPDDVPGAAMLAAADGEPCHISFVQLMSETLCFTVEDVCDVAAEVD